MYQYSKFLFVGRFAPFHNGHLKAIKEGLAVSREGIILLGSSFQPRTIKDPFSVEERTKMIKDALGHEASRVKIIPIRDYLYNDNKWIAQVQDIVHNETKETNTICLLGGAKDEWYFKLFPKWDRIKVDPLKINATDIRNMYFGEETNHSLAHIKPFVPETTLNFLKEFITSDPMHYLAIEWGFIKDYKKAWAKAPYPPTFVTTDAVVIQSGHVLLVERGAAPGKGLWALPGGFLNQNEKIEDCCFRELEEETKIDCPEKVLRGNIKASKVFDHPDRSLRGRTITHAFYVQLPDGKLPKVKGSDDAKTARWFEISDVIRMSDQIYEDHLSILLHFYNLN